MSGRNLGEHAEIFQLDDLAKKIRAIGKRAFADIIEIGQLLTTAKTIAGHGNWLPWLDKNFGWSDNTARNFMRLHEMAKNEKFADLDLPVSSLYLLAAPSTPDKVREAVIERSERGEKPSATEIKGMIESAAPAREPVLEKALVAWFSEHMPDTPDIRVKVGRDRDNLPHAEISWGWCEGQCHLMLTPQVIDKAVTECGRSAAFETVGYS